MCGTRSVLAFLSMYIGLAQSWEFAITKGDLLEFYNNDTIIDSVRFDSQNLTALIYDNVHNMMLYVNKQSGNDVICGYDISALDKKCFIEGSGRNIRGLVVDPVTEKLFFSDTKERSINWISLKHGSDNNVYGNLLVKMADGIPTDITVDSCTGHVYWINTNLTTPTIERAQFDGLNREVIITSVSLDSPHKLEPHSLVIDEQTQKIYWMEPFTSSKYIIYYADLNGKNKIQLNSLHYNDPTNFYYQPSINTLSLSNTHLYLLDWCSDCIKQVFKLPKTYSSTVQNQKIKLQYYVPSGVAVTYKIEEKIQGIKDCEALTSLVRTNSMPFCVHGLKVNGSLCKCSPGYIGERCDVSVCKNYCVQGNCTTNDEGLPECRCNAGYSGDRCEEYVCAGYCLNGGDCTLNENSEPVCGCTEEYAGDRCEVSGCLNYCIQGNCTINNEGLPECRCEAGYSGNRCEVDLCHGYCLNNGTCTLNAEEEPFCQCVGDHAGTRCEGAPDVARTSTDTSKYYPAVTNLTLADLLTKWRKPKMFVIVEE